MQIQITRQSLLASLIRASQFSDARSTVPVLGCALFDATGDVVTLTATNMEQQITAIVDCTIKEPGKALVPVSQILDIVRRLDKDADVSMTAKDGKLTVRSGRYHSSVSVLDPDDFPVMSSAEYTSSFSVEGAVFKRALDRVSFAISTEETRFYLCGVYMHLTEDKLKFCATDGHRLAVSGFNRPENIQDFDGIIIPKKLVSEISRALDGVDTVNISISQSRILFDIEQKQITGKLIDGSFPEYDRVIPKHNENDVTVDSRVLHDTVQRVAAVSSLKSKPVKFELSENSLDVSCSDGGNIATDNVACVYDKNALTIGFQARYIADVLSGITSESMWLFDNESSPVIILDEKDENVLFVLMPMRV